MAQKRFTGNNVSYVSAKMRDFPMSWYLRVPDLLGCIKTGDQISHCFNISCDDSHVLDRILQCFGFPGDARDTHNYFKSPVIGFQESVSDTSVLEGQCQKIFLSHRLL